MFDWLLDLFTKPANNYGSNNGGAGRQNTLNTANKNNTSTSTKNTYGGAPIKTTVLLDKKEYPVYKNTDGSYYIIKDGKQQNLYGGMGLMDTLKNNYSVCVDITNDNLTAGANKLSTPSNNNTTDNKPAITPLPSGSNLTNTNTNTNTTTNKGNTNNNYYTGNASGGYGYNSNVPSTNATLDSKPPKFASAAEAAKKHGIEYDLAKILAEYNKSTNEFYDNAIKEQEADRTKYLQSSSNYANRVMDEYLESFQNAAATAAHKGATAASAFISNLNAQAAINENDFGMLQTINNLQEQRKAELANNPNTAEQYYNKLGTYLSDLATTEYTSNVKKYNSELKAYAQNYASNQLLAAAQAKAASAKYAGLANQAQYNAQAKSNAAISAQKLYDFYLQQYGDAGAASALLNTYGLGGNN